MVIGLRYQVGGDWITYQFILDQIAPRPLEYALTTTDPAYGLLNWLAATAGVGIWAVNLVCAAIFTAGLISFCKGQPSPRLALLVALPYLVIVVAMGYTRQSAAIGLIMLAVGQLRRNSLPKMIACLFLAVLFHRTAVLVLPLFALSSSRRGLLTLAVVFLLTVIAYRYFLSDQLDTLVRNYRAYNSAGATVRVLMTASASLIFLLFRKKFEPDPVQNRLWTFFALASFVALAALIYAPSSAGIDRAALYLIPIQVVVFSRIPTVFSATGQSTMTGVALIVAYSTLVELVWLNFGAMSAAWVPYQNYLVVWLT